MSLKRISREGHCDFEGCKTKIKAKRLCQYHYYKELYPRNRDRPNVFPKKDPKPGALGSDIWDLIAKDLQSGKLTI